MAKKILTLSAIIVFLLLYCLPASASDAFVLQTGELSINSWHLHYSRHTFSVSDGKFAILRVTKATPDKQIGGGFLFLNLRAIPLKHFFQGQALSFEKKVRIRSVNHLNVFLHGTPGAAVTIDIRMEDAPYPAPTISFAADPSTITLGDAATLTWQTENSESVTIDNAIGSVSLNGSIQVIPTETTTYTLTATGPGGTASSQTVVTVTHLPPVVRISAVPDTIVTGGSSVLTWSSDFAQSCVIEPGIGVVELNGSLVVWPTETTTYKIIATGEGGESSAEAVVTVTDPPPTVELTASAQTITMGESATLSWTSTNAASCVVDPGVGTVEPNGSIDVSPTETTTYTISATGTGGTATAQVTIAVEHPAPSITFSASPSSVLLGQSSTLNWSTTHADTVEIDQNIGSVAQTDSRSVSPTQTTTYTLTATGPGGTATAQVTVTVTVPMPTVSLQISPGTITLGEQATLSWTSSNAVSASLDNGIGTVAVNDSMTVSPAATTTYTITAIGVGGHTVSDSVTLTVNQPPPIVSILIDPNEIIAGQAASLSWSSMYADTIAIDQGIGSVTSSGSQSVSPGQTTTYTITATGPGGTSTESVTLTVHVPPTAQITADPQTIRDGEEVTLTWSTTNADAVTITPDIGTVAASGSATVAPSQTTNYIIAASGPGGSATHAVLVTVTHSPIAEIAVNPDAINSGETATLSWSTTYADTVTFNPDIGSSELNGSVVVSPAQSTAYSITATGPGGTTSSEVKLVLNAPMPTVSISASSEIITKGESITLTWSTTDADACNIEPGIGDVAGSGTLVVTPDQDTVYAIRATGSGGTAEASVHVEVQDLSGGPVLTLDPVRISIAAGESVTLNWTTAGAQSAYFDNGLGAVPLSGSIAVSPAQTTIYTLTASGSTGSSSARALVEVAGHPQPQPEGSFGEIYNDLIPPDATVASYDVRRFSIITGMVNDIGDTAIEGVMVSILGHAEYGTAYTDGQGRFAIPVEGGGPLVVVYRKEGLISVQRQVDVPWNDVAVADTIQMLVEDTAATTVVFDGNPDTVITHQSTPFTDDFGTRATTLVFTGDNMAYAVDENGNDLQQLATITTRATEYATLDSMPAQLPPTSAYTYCAELKVDGVRRVRFEQPITVWVDNFIGFPVGEVVPVGYYDRDRGVWVPLDNGVVVQLLDTDDNGVVDALDATGDGLPDDLDNNGSTTNEINGLTDSARYAPGVSYWRAQISHFTPVDLNWPFGPPPDAIWPDPSLAADYSKEDCRRWPNPEVRVRARIVDREIPIPGTDMALHYASNRVEGYQVLFEIDTGHEQIPASLEDILIQIKVAGVTINRGWKASADGQSSSGSKSVSVSWNGKNFRGQSVYSAAKASINVGYIYRGDTAWRQDPAELLGFLDQGRRLIQIVLVIRL